MDLQVNYRVIAFWVVTLAILILGFVLFWPFLNAIFLAIVLGVLTHPLYLRLRKRLSPNLSAATTLFVTVAVIAVPLVLLGAGTLVQARSAIEEFGLNGMPTQQLTGKSLMRELDEFAAPVLSKFGGDFRFERWYDENRKELNARAAGVLLRLGMGILQLVASLALAILTMFFMLRDGHKLEAPALDLMPLPRESAALLLRRMATTIRAVAMGFVVVAIIQGALAGICYSALGVRFPILWGVATILASMIPLIGPPAVYVPISIYLLAEGHTPQGIILLAIGIVVISNVDTVLRPIWVGQRTDLHFIAIFFSFLGGVLAFGPVGVVAGPVLLTAMITLSDIVRQQGPLTVSRE